MKTHILSILAAISIENNAQASVKHWVNEPEKTVLIAVNPVLNVSLQKLEVDETYFGRLDVSLNYSSKDMTKQVGAVMGSFPGYKLQRVVVVKNGSYRFEIPALQIAKEIEPSAGVEGPYIEEQIYLSRAKYKVVQALLNSGKLQVSISGSLIGTVPLMKVIERKEIDNAICEQILGQKRTLAEIISKFATAALSAISELDIRHNTTRTSLLRDIQDNCFELRQPTKFNSFAEVLALTLEPRALDRKLFGETLQKVYEREELPLRYESHFTGAEL